MYIHKIHTMTTLKNLSILLIAGCLFLSPHLKASAYPASDTTTSDDVQTASESEQPSYTFNEELGIYTGVPETTAGVDSLLQIAETLRVQEPQQANRAAVQAHELAKKINYDIGIAGANKTLGALYMTFGDHDLALNYLFTSLEINQSMENDKEVAHVMNIIASVHVMQENYDQAVTYFSEAINKMSEIGDMNLMAMSLMNLGVSYYYKGNYHDALENYERTRELTEQEVPDDRMHMIAITNIGNVLIELGDYQKAEEYLTEAIEFFSENNYRINLSGTYLYLAKLYHRTGRFDEALMHAHRGRNVALEIDQNQYILESYERLASIYEDLQDYQSAHHYFKSFHNQQKEIFNSERSAQIHRMQIQFDVEQKDREIDLLNKEAALREAELAQKQLWQNIFIVGFILFAVIAVLLFRYNSQKKRANRLLNQRSEEIRKKNEQLVQLNEEKNEFLGIAAHDLRSPLASVVGFTELLKTTNGNDQDLRDEYVAMIKKSTDRMLSLINNLLDVNAIESGLANQKLASINFHDVLPKVVDSFRKTASNKNIQMHTGFSSEPVYVDADKDHLWSIMENLVSNAIKFSPEGSTVSVTTEVLNDRIDIIVEDNGPGISKKDQKNLFKRYNRLSNKPTGNESSNGLGLFIVKNLTESMGGIVRCKSTPGLGTTFIVSFPVLSDKTEPIQLEEAIAE